MASSIAPPTVSSTHPVKPQYELGELPEVASADPSRSPLDAFKLGIAKLVAEAWNEDVGKVFDGLDTSEPSLSVMSRDNG